MVTAEKGIAGVNNVLAVDPVAIHVVVVVVLNLVRDVEIHPPWSQGGRRNRGGVGQDVITPFGPQRAGKAHKGHLDRSRSSGKDFVAGPAGVAVEIDEDVNPVRHNLLDELVDRP